MKKVTTLFIFLTLSIVAFGKKQSIQLAPFSIETATLYGHSRLKSSQVFRFFYERTVSPRFSIIGGFSYLSNHITIPVKCCDQNSGAYDQKEYAFESGLKYIFGKRSNRWIPYIEQDIFYKNGTSFGEYGGGGIGGSLVLDYGGAGQSLGTRTRIGVEYNLSKSVFFSMNAALAVGFGKYDYMPSFSPSVGYISNTDSFYGSNAILSEFRIGYRF